MAKKTLYPIGIQTFEKIRTENYLYVDKTEYVYNLVHGFSYVFLSRPRRFGKSLLVSTFESYFEGRKELFEGLRLGELETEWVNYPVFRFDMSTAKYQNIEDCENRLNSIICNYEKIYGADENDKDIKGRLESLYKRAYEQTGKKVVILIDEYDSPMLEVMNDHEKMVEFRNLLRSFYSPIKSSDKYIRFAFITGITKFSQLSIFSEINNLEQISMTDRFSGICGITKDEIITQLGQEVESFAEKLETTPEDALLLLKKQYDGYHFSKKSEDVFNPFSLLSALKNGELGTYWFSSGTPSWLISQLQEKNTDIQSLEGCECGIDDFDISTEDSKSTIPLLFQSGYITIKHYDKLMQSYILGYPNNEVRLGMVRSLIPHYVNATKDDERNIRFTMQRCLLENRIDDLLSNLRSFMSGIHYRLSINSEHDFHIATYLLFTSLNIGVVSAEECGAQGRADVVVKTPTHIYVFELKYDGTAESAIKQIDEKGYLVKYETDNRQVVKIGANFDSKSRTLNSWIIDDGNEQKSKTF
ncbi:MAG: ATP-binding protein [Paludibacteraceae bacterium]|nr:ATP-binding protein [Paludibacteraceae bacterium]